MSLVHRVDSIEDIRYAETSLRQIDPIGTSSSISDQEAEGEL